MAVQAATGDPAFYFGRHDESNTIDGVVITQVNDVLGTGTPAFYHRTLHLFLDNC